MPEHAEKAGARRGREGGDVEKYLYVHIYPHVLLLLLLWLLLLLLLH